LLDQLYVEDESRDCLHEEQNLNAVHHAPSRRNQPQIRRLFGEKLVELNCLLLLVMLRLVQTVLAHRLVLATLI
jgi:hypothetical protein